MPARFFFCAQTPHAPENGPGKRPAITTLPAARPSLPLRASGNARDEARAGAGAGAGLGLGLGLARRRRQETRAAQPTPPHAPPQQSIKSTFSAASNAPTAEKRNPDIHRPRPLKKHTPPKSTPSQRAFLHPHTTEKQPRKTPPPSPPCPSPLRASCNAHSRGEDEGGDWDWERSTHATHPAQTPQPAKSDAPLPLPQAPRHQKTHPKRSPTPTQEKGEPPGDAPRQRVFCAPTPRTPQKTRPGKTPLPSLPCPSPLRASCDAHGEGWDWGAGEERGRLNPHRAITKIGRASCRERV